jgi:uncharacterized protein
MDLVKEKLDRGIIHPFNFGGEFFLFDSSTNSIFSIPEEYYFSISSLSNNEELLLDIVEGEKEEYFSSANEDFLDNRIFKSLCFIITRKCNFACRYCFAEAERSGEIGNSVMSKEVAREALNFIVSASRGRKSLEIDFFGGEPLLGFDTIVDTIEYSKTLAQELDKKFLFSLTTNASLLTSEIIDYLNRENISLILSLDGNKSVNDTFRVKRNEEGTFDEVFKNIKGVLSKRNDGYYVRGTYTSRTNNFPETVKFFYNSGIKKISIEPVVTRNSDISLKKESLSIVKKHYEELAKWYIETKRNDNELSFYHFELDLINGSCVEKLMTGCGAGVEYLSVSPEGKFYPCHQFDGKPQFELGDISRGIVNTALVDKFRASTNVLNKEPCRNCWARYLCGGGCLANNYTINNDINSCYSLGCEIQKLRLEAALYVQSKLYQ